MSYDRPHHSYSSNRESSGLRDEAAGYLSGRNDSDTTARLNQQELAKHQPAAVGPPIDLLHQQALPAPEAAAYRAAAQATTFQPAQPRSYYAPGYASGYAARYDSAAASGNAYTAPQYRLDEAAVPNNQTPRYAPSVEAAHYQGVPVGRAMTANDLNAQELAHITPQAASQMQIASREASQIAPQAQAPQAAQMYGGWRQINAPGTVAANAGDTFAIAPGTSAIVREGGTVLAEPGSSMFMFGGHGYFMKGSSGIITGGVAEVDPQALPHIKIVGNPNIIQRQMG